jgi:hypothetical protein
MRKLLILAAALSLGACGSFKWNPYDPQKPDTADAMGSAADARAQAVQRCGPMGGDVRQKDDTAGTRSSDWECARSRPR